MNKLKIENLGNELIITLRPRGSAWHRWSRAALGPLCFISGLRMIYMYFYNSGYSGVEVFVTSLLCFYLMAHYGKIALWAFFGKEVMHIKPQHYKVYNDFKFYQTNAFENTFEKMEVDYVTYSVDEKKMQDYEVVDAEMAGRENVRGVLHFRFDNFSTQSETYVEETDLLKAIREIQSFCKKMKIERIIK